MKKTALLAFAGAMLISGAAYADISKVKENYVAGAFDDASDDWRRITSNTIHECGAFGDKKARRIDILISRYDALGDALDSGDEAAIGAAAKKFNEAVTYNGRFETCWDKISRKKGIGGKLKREVAKI